MTPEEVSRTVLYGLCPACYTPRDFVWRQEGDDRMGILFCPTCQPQETP
jgi:hypothetical protein